MQVLLTSTSYPRNEEDWQGIFIRRMSEALAERSDVALSIWAPAGPRHPEVNDVTGHKDKAWLEAVSESGGIAHLIRTGGYVKKIGTSLSLLRRLRKSFLNNRSVDIRHINWLQCAMALLGVRGRALVTVLGTDYQLVSIPAVVWLLRLVMRTNVMTIAPNAEWMEPKLQSLFGDLAKVKCVPFGVDKTWYQIQRSYEEKGVRKWLVVLRITKPKMGPLFDWGREVFREGDELHLFGPMQEQIDIPDWVNYHGAATPEDLCENWFPSAAGLISLSQHDEGRPQVMLEAMAAGLPIIASGIDAHNGLIKDGETGILVNSKEAFLDALGRVSQPEHNRAISINAREFATKAYGSWEDCAQRYVELYEELLAGVPAECE